MATYFILERFVVCLAGLKKHLLYGAFSGSEVLFYFASKCPRYILCAALFFVFFPRTHRSGVHLSPSQRKQKSGCLSNTFSLRHASCQLNTLLVTTTVGCYIKYSRVLDLGHGSTQTDIRRETDGTRQEHWQCLLLAFFICRHGYHTKCKASDACYRWQKTVPVDGTCICLPAWLADNRSASIQLEQNLVWLLLQPLMSPIKLLFMCISANEGELTLFNVFLQDLYHLWCKKSSLMPSQISIKSVFSWPF